MVHPDAAANLVEEIKVIKTNSILDKIKNQTNKSDISIKENFYIDSQKYYEKEYGFPMREIPKHLLVGKEFRQITVDRALNIFKWFYLAPSDSGLFYHALLLDALPLPPDISEVQTESGIEYHFNGHCVKDVLRPAYFYVKEIIEHLKAKTDLNRTSIEQFALYDAVGRTYTVNLRRVYSEWLRYPDQRHLINYTLMNEGIRSFKKQEQIAFPSMELLSGFDKYRMENQRRIREIMAENYAIELSTEITSSSLG